MYGPAGTAAIKISADEDVSEGLFIGEGFETCLAAYLAGFGPVWALGNAGAIAKFPVLDGIECLTILGERNDGNANIKAAQECADRWIEAGCDVILAEPLTGDDFNDVMRKAS
jgi:putative DNA primase/helicase